MHFLTTTIVTTSILSTTAFGLVTSSGDTTLTNTGELKTCVNELHGSRKSQIPLHLQASPHMSSQLHGPARQATIARVATSTSPVTAIGGPRRTVLDPSVMISWSGLRVMVLSGRSVSRVLARRLVRLGGNRMEQDSMDGGSKSEEGSWS